jgi:5-formyltetrahydrofolate cyclo-ligase
MANSQTGSTAKAALREAFRDAPVLWPPTASDAIAEQVRALVGVPRVASCYLSYGDEAPTALLRNEWRDAGVRLLVPVKLTNNDLDWVLDDGTAGHGKHYVEPLGQRLGVQAVAACEVIIVPVMAVGEDGVRLGQGGGSYDRALARLPRVGRTIIALAHDERVLPMGQLPSERHDILVDYIITPHRTVRVPGH